MIETGQINLDEEIIQEVYTLNPQEKQESPSIIEIREAEQYGIKLSLENETLNKLLNTAKIILDKTKEILEK